MRAFCRLFIALDRTTRTSEKVAALQDYFLAVNPADGAWALWFLSGQRLKRLVKTTHLRQWVAEAAGWPLWLVEESYEHVGDLAETLALLLPPSPDAAPPPLAELVEKRLLPLAGSSVVRQRECLRETWTQLDTTQCFVWHKLITGNFRVGVSRALLIRALAGIAGVEPPIMAHRLLGRWQPTAADFARLMSGELADADPARPYPFYLASPLEGQIDALGPIADWQVEWKWDGIRAQLIRRAGEAVLWSRGEEIITSGFPEISEAARAIPEGTVLDGELLAWRDAGPLSFSHLQRRLNRSSAGAELRRDVPVIFMAYDLLESDGIDTRARPLSDRRRELEKIITEAIALLSRTRNARSGDPACESRSLAAVGRVASRGAPSGLVQEVEIPDLIQAELFSDDSASRVPLSAFRISPALHAASWDEVAAYQAEARAVRAEGLLLKDLNSAYGTGRQRGAWWKWKVSPFTCDVVLVAAQPGHGRRATLFTDYTFAVWKGNELVPVAKAYSGLTDEEIDEVDAFVRANTTGRFGPVRSVKPELVFELAFEGIAQSTRHKAGLALRFPRIARWRRDKPVAEADTIGTLQTLARGVGNP